MALQLSSVSCCSHAIKSSRLASQILRTDWFFLKCLISVIFCQWISFFISWNAISCSLFHLHSVPLLSGGRSEAHDFSRLGITCSSGLLPPLMIGIFLVSLALSGLKRLGFFRRVALLRFLIRNIQAVPFSSVLFYIFSSLSAIPASSSVFITSSTFAICCSYVPFVTTIMSSMNANVF